MKPYPAYKPSGVPWLGKMPAHWESKAAKFLVTCNDDVLTEDVDPATEIVYVEIADVEEGQGIKATTDMLFKDAPSRARRQVKHGDIIVSTVRTYLKAIAPVENPPDNLVVSTGFAVLRPHGVSQGFAKYAFAESGFINTVIARSNGVSYPAINATDLVRIPIPVPPVEEQQVIASYLDRETARVDTLIAEKGRLIETLREYRQATISEVVTQGLDSAAPKKPSGVPWLGGVPAHWSIEKLKFFVRFVGGGTPSKDNDEYWGGDIPWVSPKDMKRPRIDDTEDKITEDAVGSSACTMIATGAVLVVVRSGILQHTIPIAINDVPLVVNQDMKAIIPDERVQSSFLAYQIQGCQRELREDWVKQGATVESVEQQRMADSRFAIPPLVEQQAIAAFLDRETARIDTLVAHVRDEIKLLQELRSATITDAVTGKIKVS